MRTDVAGFVGFAERGPLPSSNPMDSFDAAKLAVRLSSWKEFLTTFGGFITYGYLAYAVRAFFQNGGTTCFVARIAATQHAEPSQRPATAFLSLPSGELPRGVAHLTANLEPNSVSVTTTLNIVVGDLLIFNGEGTTDFVMVEAVTGNKLHLARPLQISPSPNSVVSKYSTALLVTAKSKGNWGDRIRLDVTPLATGEAVNEFAIRVTVEAGFAGKQPQEEEFFHRLSLDKQSEYFAPSVVNKLSQLIKLDVRGELIRVGDGPLAKGAVHLQGGRDGLSQVTEKDFTGGLADLRGLRLLEEIDEISILCAPDVVLSLPPALPKPIPPPHDPCAPPDTSIRSDPMLDDPTAQPPAPDAGVVCRIFQSMLNQCERLRDRVAIIDPPASERSVSKVLAWREVCRLHSPFGALYYPWLKVPDPLGLEGLSRSVPPSGHVAGVFARIDNQFGVQRPPANVALQFATDVVEAITSEQQEELNPKGVNALRAFPGRGIRVWGARSLAGKDDSDWQFIHVRRLMSMIEESVEDSTQWAVFEPNDDALRRTLVHSLSVFLETIWRRGGLKGAIPSQAYYVKCDDTNNPPALEGLGQLVCQIGIAVAAPMEFLVFEIHRKPGETEVVEI